MLRVLAFRVAAAGARGVRGALAQPPVLFFCGGVSDGAAAADDGGDIGEFFGHREADDEGVEECAGDCGGFSGALDVFTERDHVNEACGVELLGAGDFLCAVAFAELDELGVGAAGGDHHEVAEAADEDLDGLVDAGSLRHEVVGGLEGFTGVAVGERVDEVADDLAVGEAEEVLEE